MSPSLDRYAVSLIADRAKSAHRTAQLLSVVVVALAVIVLFCWALDIAALKSILPTLASMKVNTALGLLLCGLATATLSSKAILGQPRRFVLLLAGVVTTLGAFTLAEYLAGVDFGIDQWLMRDMAHSIGRSSPGRMSAVTSLCFVIAGCALMIAALPTLRFRLAVVAALAVSLLVIAGLALVGYAADAFLHEHWWTYTGMAVHTACALFALGGALLALARSDAAFTWALSKIVTAGFTAAIAVILIVAGVVYRATDQLSQTAALVNHTHQALTVLERIDSDMADLEDSERGYVILGSEEELAQRARNKSTLRDEFVQIRALVTDNAAQTPRLDALESLVGERTRFGEQVIETRRREGFAAAEQLLASGTASALTASVDLTKKNIRDEELLLLRVREAVHDTAITRTFLLLPLGVFLCLALLSLGIFVLNAEAVERAKAATILETMSDAFVSWDRNWLYTHVNAAAEQTLRSTREELLGRNVLELFHSTADDPARPFYERAMAERVAVSFEVFYPPLSIWAEVRAYPAADGGLSVFFRDVTERAGHRIAQEESEARLREAQRIGRIGDWEFDLTTGAVTWSPQVFEIHGRDPREGPPRNLEEVVAMYEAESATRLQEHVARAIESGEAQDYELVTSREGVARVHVQARALPRKDANGRVVALYGTIQDITERKNAESALLQSEERFRTMANSIPQLAWIARADGHIVWYNRRWYAYTGTTAEQMEGWGWQSVHDPAVLPKVLENWRHAIEVGESFEMEFPLRGADGKLRAFLTRGEPLRDATGKVLQWFGTNTDVTALKQAKDDVRKLNARLEERVAERTVQLETANRELEAFSTELSKDLRVAEAADSMKSTFLATMSHELRTPLNSIIGFTGIVLAGLPGPLNAEQTRQLDMVRASARHLLHLINDVLDLSKIEAGGMDLCMEPFDLRASLDLVVAQVRPLAEKKGLGLQVADSIFDTPFVSDRRRVDQILLNLLSNAVKFTEHGDISVSVDAFRDDDSPMTDARPRVRIRVADTGIGIKPEHLAMLFQPFRQIDSSLTRKYDGSGLGLVICRRLAHLLGGDVHAESALGKGSVFTVILPVSPLALAA